MKQLVRIVEITGIHADGGRIREKNMPLDDEECKPAGLGGPDGRSNHLVRKECSHVCPDSQHDSAGYT